MKRQAQQALFETGMRLPVADVQERFEIRAVGAFADEDDAAVLFDDGETVRTIRRLGHPDQIAALQLCEHRMKLDLRQRLGAEESGSEPTQRKQEDAKSAKGKIVANFARILR